jgi:hypothetical protein
LDGAGAKPVNERQFQIVIVAVAVAFTALFSVVVVPPLIDNPDIIGAFGAGFVNPYSSGYSADVIACWLILAAWVSFEARSKGVKHGWLCLALGVFPGVAVGFAAYLLIRSRQLGAPSH